MWVDGIEANVLPLPDRGLEYGDGLFETLLLVGGHPLYLDLHLQRLSTGMAALGFPAIDHELAVQITKILHSRSFPAEASMRVTVTRGGGPRGYAVPELTNPRVIVTVSALSNSNYRKIQPPARLSLASIVLGHQPRLAGIKHLNRLEQVLAASERQLSGADEVLMLDHKQKVISVSAGNIFILLEGKLLTPDLGNCGVHGTRRRLVLDRFASSLGLSALEDELTLSHFEAASEVFYCNALQGFRPVSQFAGRHWHDHKVCTDLHQLYCDEAR